MPGAGEKLPFADGSFDTVVCCLTLCSVQDVGQVLAEVKAQHALGWQGRIAYENGSLRFRLQDKTATPIAGADVKAYIERPLEEAFSQTITLKETRNGTYEAAVQLPKKGLWDVTVSTTWNKQYYQTRERLIVP